MLIVFEIFLIMINFFCRHPKRRGLPVCPAPQPSSRWVTTTTNSRLPRGQKDTRIFPPPPRWLRQPPQPLQTPRPPPVQRRGRRLCSSSETRSFYSFYHSPFLQVRRKLFCFPIKLSPAAYHQNYNKWKLNSFTGLTISIWTALEQNGQDYFTGAYKVRRSSLSFKKRHLSPSPLS